MASSRLQVMVATVTACGCLAAGPDDTAALRQALTTHASTAILVGHQDATRTGVYWTGDGNTSDVETLTGAQPALIGWDLLTIGDDSDFAQGELARIREGILAAHADGIISTVCWHAKNPGTGGRYDDLTPAILRCYPGADAHGRFLAMVDELAAFFTSLRTPQGKLVPVIFRPYHEMNGNWFWWGWGDRPEAAAQLAELWRMTHARLREKGVTNLLWAYSPDRFADSAEYLKAYPGDDYVDILGLDNYVDFAEPSRVPDAVRQLRTVVELATARGMPAALTETGLELVGRADWFTEALMEPIWADTVASRISYLMLWRNQDPEHFYVPPPRHPAATDFVRFRHDVRTIFAGDTASEAWQEGASLAAMTGAWRQRALSERNWSLAPTALAAFPGELALASARPVRARVTVPPASKIELKPTDFTWSVPLAELDLRSPQKAAASQLPVLLHGNREDAEIRAMVNWPQPSVFSVDVADVSLGGASLIIEIDGEHGRTQRYPVSQDHLKANEAPAWVRGEIATVVPAGLHLVTLRNDGRDWLRFAKIRSYLPRSRVLVHGTTTAKEARLWLENGSYEQDFGTPMTVESASLRIFDLQPGIWEARLAADGGDRRIQRLSITADGIANLEIPTFTTGVTIQLIRLGEEVIGDQ